MRGGARKGAGRKALDTVTINCRISRESRMLLDQRAKACGKGIGSVLDQIIKEKAARDYNLDT